MTADPPQAPLPDVEFATLRAVAIDVAQKASGDLWTDYNLHDPGVTFLEQTCFALTELAYRAGLPMRDLLTGREGRLGGRVSAFAGPEAVLSCAPVTAGDMIADLAALPGIARVSLVMRSRPGLATAEIVPEEGADPDLAAEAVRARFAEIRPLCTDLAEVCIAAPLKAALAGTVTLSPLADPALVAARIHRAAAHAARAAATAAAIGETEALRATVRLLPDVLDVGPLALTAADGGPLGRVDSGTGAQFVALQLPTDADGPGLTLVQAGRPVRVEPGDVRHALAGLADPDGPSEDRVPVRDATALRPGRRRVFDQISVNATLPAFYPAAGAQGAAADGPARQLAGYRALIDTLLGALLAQIEHLPDLLSADPAQTASHWTRVPEIADTYGLLRGGDARALLAEAGRADPGHARRRAVLDLLIALHGADYADGPQTGISRYVTTPERDAAALARRARVLQALPAAHERRGAVPSDTTPAGFLALLCAHLDIDEIDPAKARAAFAATELDVVADDAEPGLAAVPDSGDGDTAEAGTDYADDEDDAAVLLDMLVPVRAVPPPDDPSAVVGVTPALSRGAVRPEDLATLTEADAYLALPEGTGCRLTTDRGADLGFFDSLDAAIAHANALRSVLASCLRAAEHLTLVEDIRLRGQGGGFAPWTAHLVMPGWTPRTRMPAFRRHAESCVARLAPAHCHVQVRWLGPRDAASFAESWTAWQEDARTGPDLRAILDRMKDAP